MSAGEASERVPKMIREIQQYCGPDLPYIAGAELDYVFASRSIAHRLTVRALNEPNDCGPSDHCRIGIDLEEPWFR